ncbi:hypothetical protein DE146DRAFT_47031 [Phaeosphaeria sp. MPI-PUGE-AT-0046c]|nr:hypothetical protein DE146DRAFT_47031 [Phaeosphaeria sp. MPI-PUGE-AT-0046c]
MDSSTRLYTRLGEIPEDPSDPESLADLLVCAFGAFERYYVCWKTRGGDFRQDGYDLPPALKDWLYPSDSTTRDFATLQVVFGRGEEYFASDKNGKLEYKEPEVKKAVEDEDKPALRRARTVSFLRPLSDVSTRSDNVPTVEGMDSKRSSAGSSRRASRPPSLSFSRSSSMASMASDLVDPLAEGQTSRSYQASLLSRWEGIDASISDAATFPSKRNSRAFEPPVVEAIMEEQSQRPPFPKADHRPQPTNPAPRSIPDFSVPEGYMLIPVEDAAKPTPSTCTCGCHEAPLPQKSNLAYLDASTQTDHVPLPPRTALRIDTTRTSHWASSNEYSAVSQADMSPAYDVYPAENPIYLGRTTSYFSKPGYQLGDSLTSHYQMYAPVVYHYQDEFGEEVLR